MELTWRDDRRLAPMKIQGVVESSLGSLLEHRDEKLSRDGAHGDPQPRVS